MIFRKLILSANTVGFRKTWFLALVAVVALAAGFASGVSQAQDSGSNASLITDILGWRAEQGKESDHYKRWTRALAALGHGSHNNPMTASEAQTYVARGWGGRWQPVVDALTASKSPTNTPVPPPPTNTPVPPPPPTNTPVPPPPPTNTPVPPPPPTNTPIPPPPPTNTPVPPAATTAPSGPYASLITDILDWRDEQDKESDHYKRWTRTLAALWDKVSHTNPMTLSEAQGYVDRGWGGRWQPVVDALTALQAPTNTPVPPPPPTNTPVPPPPPTNTPAAAQQQQQQQQPQANPPRAQKSSLQGVGSQDQQDQARNFWIVRTFDTGDGNGVIDEGGLVMMQVRTSSEPGNKFVHIEARRGVREWKAYPNGAINWNPNPGSSGPDVVKYISNWANVGDSVANTNRDTLTSTGEAQTGLTGFYLTSCPGANNNQDNLKNNHTGNNCVGGSYAARDGSTVSNWTRDLQAGQWYTEFMVDSTDDSFIGPAQRVYEFRVFNTSSTVAAAQVVVTEDDSSSPGAPGALTVKQLPLRPGQNDYQGVKIETGRRYYRPYRILISLGGRTKYGGSDYDPISDLVINVPKGAKYAEFSQSITCQGAGTGYVQVRAWPQTTGPAYATKSTYIPAATHSGRDVIQICR